VLWTLSYPVEDGPQPLFLDAFAVPIKETVNENEFRFLSRCELIDLFQVRVRNELITELAVAFELVEPLDYLWRVTVWTPLTLRAVAAHNRVDVKVRPFGERQKCITLPSL
jgi:hypothetical protein